MIEVVVTGGVPFATLGLALFALTAAVLGFFDISLPRGDVIGVGSAADVLALLLLGPAQSFWVCSVGVVVLLARPLTTSTLRGRTISATSRSLALLLAAGVTQLAVSIDMPLVYRSVLAIFFHVTTLLFASEALSSATGRGGFLRALQGRCVRESYLMLAEASTVMLGVLVYPTLSYWSLVLVAILLLLIRQSYALLHEIKETYRTTIEVLIEAAEGADSSRAGHAERTARTAREIASRCNLHVTEVERISYAALLHDIGEIAAEGCHPDDSRHSASVIEDVGFFADIYEIIRITDGNVDMYEGPDADLLAAFIVALASDIDKARSGLASGLKTRLISPLIPACMKARAVEAAIRLGYSVPAIA